MGAESESGAQKEQARGGEGQTARENQLQLHSQVQNRHETPNKQETQNKHETPNKHQTKQARAPKQARERHNYVVVVDAIAALRGRGSHSETIKQEQRLTKFSFAQKTIPNLLHRACSASGASQEQLTDWSSRI